MWSISIYSGESPFDLQPAHAGPVITSDSVTDIPAEFVADPFMLQRDGTWHMFFEVMNNNTRKGDIGLATSSDGFSWTYERIVLTEPFHLSYSYVFQWQNDYYMVPETLGAGAVWLYKADPFPTRWFRIAKLIEGKFADPSIVRFKDLWWMFVCSTPYQHDTLCLFFAAELTGPWTEHPKSPMIRRDKCRARPAGRLIEFHNKLIRFAQDCVPQYGSSVRAFEITELTADDYVEVENDRSPILTASASGWNAAGMHHVDPHRLSNGKWLACVDGLS